MQEKIIIKIWIFCLKVIRINKRINKIGFSPEGGSDGSRRQVSSVVRPDDDWGVESVESRVCDALVAVGQRHALAAAGTDEPVAELLLGAVATLVTFGTFATEKTNILNWFENNLWRSFRILLLFLVGTIEKWRQIIGNLLQISNNKILEQNKQRS